MRDVLPQIHEARAELVVIGSGSPDQAKWFREDLGLTIPIYVDPSLGSFKAAGLKYGMMLNFNPRSARHAMRALRAGHRQTRTKGDPKQQGGTVVVAQGGKVLYAYADAEAGDHAPVSEVLNALAR